MNYQTEIDFALRVLQDAEDNGFDETKMQAMLQHDADYMRVFLPQPDVLVEVNRHAEGLLSFIANEVELAKTLKELMQQQEKIEKELEQAPTEALRQQHAAMRKEMEPLMFPYESPSGSPLDGGIQRLGMWLGLLLNPTNNHDFDNQLQQAMQQFYRTKRNQIVASYNQA
jgi:hypothetical protein